MSRYSDTLVCLCVFRNEWWVLFLLLLRSSSSDLLPHNHPTPLLSSRCFCWSVPLLDWQLLVHQAIPATANARCQHQTQHHRHCHHHRHRHYHRHHHHHYSSKDFTRKMIGFLWRITNKSQIKCVSFTAFAWTVFQKDCNREHEETLCLDPVLFREISLQRFIVMRCKLTPFSLVKMIMMM